MKTLAVDLAGGALAFFLWHEEYITLLGVICVIVTTALISTIVHMKEYP
jgi:hypothetical protein